MSLATSLRTLKFARRPASRKRSTTRPRLERLEDRCLLAGFGPEDGAIIVEPWLGRYLDVQIQPGDQKIVAAGGFHGIPGVVVARYDSQGNADASYGIGGLANPQALLAMGGSNLVLQPDGKAVVASSMDNPAFDDPDDAIDLPDDAIAVGRLNADGSADTSFGVGGLSSFAIPESTYSTQTRGVGLLSNGKIVVGGFISGGTYPQAITSAFVAGFTANGVIDTGNKGFGFRGEGYRLGNYGWNWSSFDDIAVQADNKVVAVGSYTDASNWAHNLVVARFTAASSNIPGGNPDPSFAGTYATLSVPGMDISARRVTLQADGKIVVVGFITGLDGGDDLFVARFTASGTLDTSFGGGNGYVRFDADGNASATAEGASDVAIQPDGKIVVAGGLSSNGVSNSLVVRFNSNGTLDGTFGTGGVKVATPPAGYRSITGYSMALAVDGSIIVAGALTLPDSNPDPEIDNYDIQPFVMRFLGDPPPVTKFYVVNDATANFTYEYSASGAAVENYALSSGNATPRGAASTAAGDTVWVVDANRNVYVYDASGGLLGSWSAGTIATNATVEGIATDGTDVWIVDARNDKVYRYAGAASRLSGSQTAASNFSLNSGNTSPKDIVTDGTSIWVVNDAATNKVFKYTIAGTLQGSWTIDAANATPTGITLDPANVSDLWIVDSGTDRVYQYSAAASRTSGSQSADAAFALAASNTNPQGIADPPAGASQASAGNDAAAAQLLAGYSILPATGQISSPAGGRGEQGDQDRMDPLSAMMHELGHTLGHAHNADGLMAETPATGERSTELEEDHVATVDQVFTEPAGLYPSAWLSSVLAEQLESTRPGGRQRR